MAVDAVYLLDEKKKIRKAIVWGVYGLVHDEGVYALEAEIDSKYKAMPGEFLGFIDVDGKLALFEIDTAEHDDGRGVTEITATDAAVAELAHKILPEMRLENATAREAVSAAISGSGYTLGTVTSGTGKKNISAYMDRRWRVLRDIAALYDVRIVPRYEIVNGAVTGKRVDVLARENTFRGRIFEGRGAAQIRVARSGTPITRMYGVGKETGTEDPPTCVTFTDIAAEDKPKGQSYIEDAAAIALYGDGREDVYENSSIEDPQELLDKTREALMERVRPAVSGTATAADVEHIPGHEHKAVRMHDLVWVKTQQGEDLQAAVIGIRRDYMHRNLTRITIGKEADAAEAAYGLIAKIANLSSESRSLKRSGAGGGNKAKENETMIRLTASNLDKYQDGTDERLTTAELTLYGDGTSAHAGLEATVRDQAGEISRAALTLYGDGTSANAGLVARVGDNEAAIVAAVDELSSEIELKADKIALKGYVTADQLDTEFSKFENGISDSLYVSALSASGFECSSFDFKGYGISLSSKTFLTTGTTITVNASGGVVTGVDFNRRSDTIYYLDWE